MRDYRSRKLYSMIRRRPVLISTVTAMPDARSTMRPSTCMRVGAQINGAGTSDVPRLGLCRFTLRS
jgi:hypothetical protein